MMFDLHGKKSYTSVLQTAQTEYCAGFRDTDCNKGVKR